MLLGDIEHLYCIMNDIDVIKVILSTGAQIEIKHTDNLFINNDDLIIIRGNDDRTVVNVNFIVYITLIRRGEVI